VTLQEGLMFLQSTAGVNFLIGAVWSYLLELIPGLADWFNRQTAAMKRVVVAGFALAVPLLAFVFKMALKYEVFTIDNLWKVLVAWGAAFFGSQLAHLAGPGHPNRLGTRK